MYKSVFKLVPSISNPSAAPPSRTTPKQLLIPTGNDSKKSFATSLSSARKPSVFRGSVGYIFGAGFGDELGGL